MSFAPRQRSPAGKKEWPLAAPREASVGVSDALDEALEDTFPASDPPAVGGDPAAQAPRSKVRPAPGWSRVDVGGNAMLRAKELTYTLLRVAAGFMFMLHGGQKLFGWFGGLGGNGPVILASKMGLAGCLEFFGGLAVLLGLLTRPVAFVLAGEMAVAYFTVHLARGALPIQNGGESAALFAMIFLFLAAHGAGPLSLDAVIRRSGGGIRGGSVLRGSWLAPHSSDEPERRAG